MEIICVLSVSNIVIFTKESAKRQTKRCDKWFVEYALGILILNTRRSQEIWSIQYTYFKYLYSWLIPDLFLQRCMANTNWWVHAIHGLSTSRRKLLKTQSKKITYTLTTLKHFKNRSIWIHTLIWNNLVHWW